MNKKEWGANILGYEKSPDNTILSSLDLLYNKVPLTKKGTKKEASKLYVPWFRQAVNESLEWSCMQNSQDASILTRSSKQRDHCHWSHQRTWGGLG